MKEINVDWDEEVDCPMGNAELICSNCQYCHDWEARAEENKKKGENDGEC